MKILETSVDLKVNASYQKFNAEYSRINMTEE